MERAPLRPVPVRPSGLVDPAAVAAALPHFDDAAVRALAAVMSGRRRGEVAPEIGVEEEELARVLAAARKALRKTAAALPGSGWCERAERLISDRLDGEVGSREVLFLDIHLRNCPRCVEHERRLVQATDALLVRTGERPAVPVSSRSAAALAVVVERPPPELPSAQPPMPVPRAWHALAAGAAGLVMASVLLVISAVL
jgi:hypothetical protein